MGQRQSKNLKKEKKKLIFSFAGGGWTFPFYFGVAKFLSDNFDKLEKEFEIVLCGNSAGAIACSALIIGLDIEKMNKDGIEMRKDGYFSNINNALSMNNFVKTLIENSFPTFLDYTQFNDRLYILLTEYEYYNKFTPKYFNKFDNRETILQLLNASCFIPVLCGQMFCNIDDSLFLDGGICTNYITGISYPDEIDDTYIKVPVSTYLENGDEGICSGIKFPKYWTYVPESKEKLEKIYELGYLKAQDFFMNSNLFKDLCVYDKSIKEKIKYIQETILK